VTIIRTCVLTWRESRCRRPFAGRSDPFSIARFVCDVPIPWSGSSYFPWDHPQPLVVWNVLHLASRSRTHLPLGFTARFFLHARAGRIPPRRSWVS